MHQKDIEVLPAVLSFHGIEDFDQENGLNFFFTVKISYKKFTHRKIPYGGTAEHLASST